MCICMWRSEVNLRCLSSDAVYLAFFFFFLIYKSFTPSLKLAKQGGWLATEPRNPFVCLQLPSARITRTCHHNSEG